ncbi:VOC family protein [Xanthomonas oryzae pv. oryzae]|uniref:VOC family protein n=1 Tax=Xanthomonas oryzae TaxID=347 RepID=UPI00094A106F|nr:VOC family protein [Xanthomonas oryzae]MDI9072168.1 VOC family protein [Xanthomonas oryzae pv. oryzae]MDI9078217.1 VOC family protein [Xanthomonas oryzae pv. oryzae]MDI9105577.1 VOC family protein [Xanthomonas oryzae pv. oryzae]MDI9913128.1 VOC family protein [Xanthomonas oryzae pv. oryzae]OLH15118.1 glyoxalase [Xanthomonas oryzae pv. oryzae]
METSQLSRGCLIDHLCMVVHDLPASGRFYQTVLDVLGIPLGGEGDGFFWADELFASDRDTMVQGTMAQGVLTGRHHLAFQARDVAMVHAFHQAALAHGGRDNGAPGLRPYHPHYAAGFVPDPDGNNLEAVFHSVAQHSANAVQITF